MKKFRNMMLLLAVAAVVSACSGKQGGTAAEGTPSGGSEENNVQDGDSKGQESAGQAGDSKEQEAQAEDSAAGADMPGSENTFTNLNKFQATALDGSTFTQEDFADCDVTVINFWALSCGPCIAEMPDLAELEKALPDNVQLITVCLDGSGNEELVEYVLEESGFEGITLLSGDGDLLTLSGELRYTPTTLFADSLGNTVGDVITGRRENLADAYIQCINDILTDMGKEEISVGTGTE